MVQNFTYLAFLCGISMLLIVGGVVLTKLPVMLQTIMIFIGLVGGVFCFITLIRVLIKHNTEGTKKE
ncbi:MAG: sodium:potassium antiporter [Solibacillus sp.]|uniref:sodium:potassium antiporter n=1 Tax=unclassified Solibacillus TaxID=2637870 RepID=UPI0030F8A66A